MEPKVIAASEFKAKCLALLDRVAETKQPLIVTKHGTAVARVEPCTKEPARSLKGSVIFLTDRDEELYSTGQEWDPENDDVPGFP